MSKLKLTYPTVIMSFFKHKKNHKLKNSKLEKYYLAILQWLIDKNWLTLASNIMKLMSR